jgi:hypothetical protein
MGVSRVGAQRPCACTLQWVPPRCGGAGRGAAGAQEGALRGRSGATGAQQRYGGAGRGAAGAQEGALRGRRKGRCGGAGRGAAGAQLRCARTCACAWYD